MRRVPGWMLATLAVLGASSCAQHRAEVVDCKNFVMSPSQYMEQFAGRPGQETQQELSFICHADIYGRAQMIYAGMAQQRSASPAVREFAAQSAAAQREMIQRLNQIAIQQEGVTPPRGLDASHLALRNQLAQLSGAAFDRAYLQSAVQDGQAAIALFRKAGSGMEPILGQFASGALPGLQQRASQAQGLLQQAGY